MRKSRLNRLVLCGLLLVACGLFLQVRRQRVNSVQYVHDELVRALRTGDEATFLRRTTAHGRALLNRQLMFPGRVLDNAYARSVLLGAIIDPASKNAVWSTERPGNYRWYRPGLLLTYRKTAAGWQLDVIAFATVIEHDVADDIDD